MIFRHNIRLYSIYVYVNATSHIDSSRVKKFESLTDHDNAGHHLRSNNTFKTAISTTPVTARRVVRKRRSDLAAVFLRNSDRKV